MAKGKVKKGFKDYLLVLFLAIIATFLVIVTIMLFSPFKNILGFKYFTYNETTKEISTVTGGREDEPFVLDNIQNINIDCTYADVMVERFYKIDHLSFQFSIAMSGFAKEDQNTDFTYEMYYTDDTKTEVNVKVKEPEGFLFFSKKVKIKVLVPTSYTNSFENTSLTIHNTVGDVYLGNSTRAYQNLEEDFRNYIGFGDVNIITNKGDVSIRQFTNSNMNKLFINSKKGKITSKIDIVANEIDIHSQKSEINFKKLVVNGENAGKLNLGNAEFYSTYLKGDVNLAIESGYFDIDKLEGSLSANDAIKPMDNAQLTIKDFSGYMSLPFLNKSRVNIGKVAEGSQLYLHSTKGDIKISENYSNVTKIETTEGDVDVYTYGQDVDIKTTKGDIDLTFDSTVIANQIDLVSKEGEINIKVKADLSYTLMSFNASGNESNKNVYIEGFGTMNENPMDFINGGNVISVTTNSDVSIKIF